MSRKSPCSPRPFNHRWCVPVRRAVVLVGVLPALFGGAFSVMLLTLVLLGGLGLLLFAGTRRTGQGDVRPSSRAVFALTTDALLLLVGAGLLIGALSACSGTAPVLSADSACNFIGGLAAFWVVHHIAHRRYRR